MSKEEKRVPELRFEGFHDDWEQRKLIEVADYRNGKAHEKDISENGDYIVVNSKFVSTNGAVKKFSDELIAPLKKGELAFVLSDVPNGRAIARTFLIDEDNKYSLNQRIAGIIPHSDTNSYFLHSLMNRHHYFLRFDDGAGQTNLSKKEVENWTELYPSIEEQDKIGSFFKQLDDTITLHQRKLEQLRELKKAALQTLFPQKTETEPRVRFANFNEPWKARKLGDYLSIPKKEKKVVKKSDELITVKLNLGGVVLGSSRDTLSLGATAYYVRHSGQLIYGKQNFFNGSIAIIPDNLDGKASSGDVPSFDIININSDYLYTFISRPVYWKQKEAFASGTGSKRIHESTFLNFDICLPNTYDEQQAIGCYFKKLEKLTILYQSKLERLLSLKKSFLQKMFI
ncbi:restriction endonuclease subunit S [Tetragenococcus halophilus]|uniref:restriction endonuclease subunit S n=1 Tax=Tetragenococcus halophilus TaxID=51669 RepID=UPI0020946CE8|nr:restriction endonuclease subunit S [Tetragenococcus halophilus]MCO7026462.1 restriction endonuclease subunit S [Tetragenococcus halophilus]